MAYIIGMLSREVLCMAGVAYIFCIVYIYIHSLDCVVDSMAVTVHLLLRLSLGYRVILDIL